MRLLPRSLLDRVFLLYAFTLTVTLAVGLAVFLDRDVEREIHDKGDKAMVLAEILAQSIADSVIVNDFEAVKRTLSAAVTHTDFASARYLDVQGSELKAESAGQSAGHVPAFVQRWVDDQLPEMNRVISAGGRDYGVLRLAFTTADMAATIWHTILGAVVFGAATLVAGLVLTRWQLARWLANLDRLGSTVEQIQAGELDVTAGVSGDAPEEVRRAIEHFNVATRGLRDRYGQRIDALAHALVQHKRATDQALIVVEVDPEGTVRDVNDLFCAVAGWPRDAVVGRRGLWGLEIGTLHRAADADATDHCWSGELLTLTAHGQPIWLKRSIVPIRDESGTLEKFICLDIDIRREKDAERTLIEEKQRAEVTLHSIAEGVLTTGADDQVQFANPAAQKILGLDLPLLAHRRVDEIVRLLKVTPLESRSEAGVGEIAEVLMPGGQFAVLELSRAPLHDAAGRPAGAVIAFRDVTDEQRTRRELQRLSLVVQHAASGIYITDPQGRIEYVNPKFTALTGYTLADLRGATPALLRPPQANEASDEAMWSSVMGGHTWRGELRARRKDGSQFWCAQTLTPVIGDDGQPRQFVAVMEDVSDQKTAQETIHRLAYYDALTDLPNRRMFMERAVQQVKAARLDDRPIAVCYLDLDGFKNVNDTLGHQFGDRLLTEVGQRLSASLRQHDFLGRLGGDEFALLLHGVESPAMVEAIGRRIIESIERAVTLDGHDIHVSTSIGVSMFPVDGQDVADLLRKADMALYRAKELGKRRLEFFTEEIEALKRDRNEIEAALHEALPRGELRLDYQPKVDLQTGRVVGAEALLRWQHGTKGRLSPDVFIPLAEETRLIVPIGAWVLAEACRQIRAWNDAGLAGVRVAVNLSSVQFRSATLVDDIERAIGEADIDAGQLELEITESGLIEDPDGAAEILRRLRAIGLTIAIDDFGTGYSSLAYLKTFPVSVLKVDRSFVRDLEHDANDRGIAEAVVSMARVLKVDVVAEGVETEGQRRILRRLGCQLGQGYLFSRPLGPEDFVHFWHEHRRSIDLSLLDIADADVGVDA